MSYIAQVPFGNHEGIEYYNKIFIGCILYAMPLKRNVVETKTKPELQISNIPSIIKIDQPKELPTETLF